MDNNTTLKNILKEYEQKRLQAQLNVQYRVQDLYANYPRLAEIEHEINSIGIKISKTILASNDSSVINNLKISIQKLNKEKNTILKNIGIDNSFFTPNYMCSVCSDTGYIQTGSNSTMCNCLKQKLFDVEYNKSNLGNLEFENFDTFNLDLYSNESNSKKFKSTLSPRDNIKIIKDISIDFVNNFDDPSYKNLLFTGATGLGKTFLSNCIANEILKKGRTVLYQTAPVMLDSIVDYKFGKSNSFNVYNNLLNVDLLIIDDLGTESMNSVKFSELFNIINTRLLNQTHHVTKTIISTNLTMQDLFTHYDERIVSRIRGYYKICPFFGDDIRVYSSSIGPK